MSSLQDPNHNANHIRVRRRRGKASAHNCVSCGEQAYEWAWQHGTDPADIANYEPMCRSCHRKYDYPLIPQELKDRRIAAMNAPDSVRRRTAVTNQSRSEAARRGWDERQTRHV